MDELVMSPRPPAGGYEVMTRSVGAAPRLWTPNLLEAMGTEHSKQYSRV